MGTSGSVFSLAGDVSQEEEWSGEEGCRAVHPLRLPNCDGHLQLAGLYAAHSKRRMMLCCEVTWIGMRLLVAWLSVPVLLVNAPVLVERGGDSQWLPVWRPSLVLWPVLSSWLPACFEFSLSLLFARVAFLSCSLFCVCISPCSTCAV